MIEKTENKIRSVLISLENGHKSLAARKVKALTKKDTVYLITHTFMVDQSYMGNRDKQICLENFVINSLDGLYS